MPLPLKYERCDGVDYIGGRKVAFWHLQSDFCDYLGYAAFRNQIGNHGRVPWVRTRRPASYSAYRVVKKSISAYTRGRLIRKFFADGRDPGFLFNDKRFWQKGVFV